MKAQKIRPYNMHAARVLGEVMAERENQDERWGEQNHPAGVDENLTPYVEKFRRICDQATEDGKVTWFHIAVEEFLEAFTETDRTKRRGELIQLAAVIVAAIESHDREGA